MFLSSILKKIFRQNVLVLLGLLLTAYSGCGYAINEEYIQNAESGLLKLVIPRSVEITPEMAADIAARLRNNEFVELHVVVTRSLLQIIEDGLRANSSLHTLDLADSPLDYADVIQVGIWNIHIRRIIWTNIEAQRVPEADGWIVNFLDTQPAPVLNNPIHNTTVADFRHDWTPEVYASLVS